MSVEHTTYIAPPPNSSSEPIQINNFSSVIKRTIGDIRLRSMNITLGKGTKSDIINIKEVEVNTLTLDPDGKYFGNFKKN